MRATLLSHGYTVVIKATAGGQEADLRTEAENYRRLRALQGQQIPVYIGDFKPGINYWYHGQRVTHMMVLSWAGHFILRAMNGANAAFCQSERNGGGFDGFSGPM